VYQAELCGKLPSSVTRMEDILTSNVFSFLKYANREIFLRGYLERLGFDISGEESKNASFLFWPRYEEKTEPDLVIIAGPFYLLVEAKYFSGFGDKTEKSEAQLVREIKGGLLEAKNYGKQFALVAITADHIYKDSKFTGIPEEFRHLVKWTNWQRIAAFLNEVLNGDNAVTPHEREFALDLYYLLDSKSLRGYQGTGILYSSLPELDIHRYVFFRAETARYRGDFIGFTKSLATMGEISQFKKRLFFSHRRSGFRSFFQQEALQPVNEELFFKGGNRNDQRD